jgi:hypothetical protein
VIAWLRRTGRRLLYGGSGRLRPYEVAAVEHGIALLSEADQAVLRGQLAQLETVQRYFRDRLVNLYFDAEQALPRIASQADDHCLAKVRLAAAAVRVSAALVVHQGILRSIEFSRPPRGLGNAPQAVSASLGGRHRSITLAVDRLEHGK